MVFVQAGAGDDVLLLLMEDFYAEESLPFTRDVARAAMTLLERPEIGCVYLLREAASAIGYFVLTFGYSLERGGRVGLLDELFIVPAHRRKGLATAAVHFVIAAARAAGCRALHLEVSHENAGAQTLYARTGFSAHGRDYLTRPL